MKNEYPTEAMAQRALDAKGEKPLDCFCPVINDRCRRDCACYAKGAVRKHNVGADKYFSIYAPSCTHPFISGEIVSFVTS